MCRHHISFSFSLSFHFHEAERRMKARGSTRRGRSTLNLTSSSDSSFYPISDYILMFCHKQLVVLVPESSQVWKDKVDGCNHYPFLDRVLQQQQIHSKTRRQEAITAMAAVTKSNIPEEVLRQALPPEEEPSFKLIFTGENQWHYWTALRTYPANFLHH